MCHLQLRLALVASFAVCLWAIGGCAAGSASSCDPADEACQCEGAGCAADASPGELQDAGPNGDGGNVDAGPMYGFGEACTDKGECESNICILVGIGGVCSDFCSDDSCPDGYGCFGVFGAVEPGEVADVCVPQSTQLCSPCQMHSECAIVGADLCLPNDDNRNFCARDCSSVSCPTGFACTSVQVEGADFQQCLPLSGACDCTAAELGNVESCNIVTDFGSCEGSRTCAGGAGWGTCEAPSTTDSPDAAFVDDNCDGIDGELDGGIFVAANTGGDGVNCGLVYTDPCSTIGFATIRALQSGRGELYVQAGDYDEVVVLVNGIDIYGGYDVNWQRDLHTIAEHRVTITGAQDTGAGGDGQFLTVRAHNLVVVTKMADLVIVGPDASGADASGARSSYALHLESAIVDLERVSIVAGNGASGSDGSVGLPTSSANATAAMAGSAGGAANEFTTDCNASSHGSGGASGINSCSGTRNPNGGTGGNGGEMDTGCDCFLGACVCGPCAATDGDAGGNAGHIFGTLGTGGGAGSGGGSCTVPSPPGRDGRIQNGAAGIGATDGGFLNGAYWYARSGGSGGLGQNGGGGGGGGGSGGCDTGIDSFGAGGGGGGAGGCAATSSAAGGRGGGASFGIFAAASSTLTASECAIQRGSGGKGGSGGNGGHGQRAGSGASGGLADGDSKAGGSGGSGAHGGHGGGGGGGSGGVSVGVYLSGSAGTNDCVITGGSGGAGGSGGLSAPLAPVADRDGNNGTPGASGALVAEDVCSDPASC